MITTGIVKPRDVMRNLHQQSITNVSIRQLRTFIAKIKDENGIGSLNFGELTELVGQLSVVPTDCDAAFICSSEMVSSSEFRFFITSKKLLLAASGKRVVHADATYKITYHGYPMHVYGM